MSRFTANLRSFVQRLTSHSQLSDAEQQVILDLPITPRRYDSNRDIVRPGETVSYACVVVEGMAGRFGQTLDGARQITAIHLPGDAPDLHSVVLPASISALQALTATTLLQIPHAALREAATRFPAIAEAFWRDCMVDAAIQAEWVTNIGRRDARARVAHLICEMALRTAGQPTGGSTVFALPLTQTHLADATGLTSVHVNRTLRALREEGLAHVESRTVRVLDWAGLVRAGDFQADYLLPLAERAQAGRRCA